MRVGYGGVRVDENVRGFLAARWKDRRCLSRGEMYVFRCHEIVSSQLLAPQRTRSRTKVALFA